MMEKELVRIFPIKIKEKNLEDFDINLTKDMEDSYDENYKIF